MNLDETQKQKVAEWVQNGLQLSEIQDRLKEEFGLTITYMDLRFLVSDLQLQPADKERQEIPIAGQSNQKAPGPQQDSGQPKDKEPHLAETEYEGQEQNPPSGTAQVSVSVDQVARPGALVSGKVKFSDGEKGEWYLDQTGRLGLAMETQGYKPSQEDLMAFQNELQSQLQKMGF